MSRSMNKLRRAAAAAMFGIMAAAPFQAEAAAERSAPPSTDALGGPAFKVVYSPVIIAGQSFRVTWTTAPNVKVTHSCTAAGTGLNENFDVPVLGSGYSDQIADAKWVNYPSTCIWSADNDVASTDITKTITTLPASDPPKLWVFNSPDPLTATQPYSVNWGTSNTATVTRVCTAAGSGFVSSGSMAVQGPENGIASPSWVGYPSTCIWTATNAAGVSTQVTQIMTTNAAPPVPTISVSRTPNPMSATMGYSLNWTTTDADLLNRVCTAAGGGFTSNAAMNLQGPESGTASASWVGYPSTCVWTATNSIGVTAQFTETMTTNPAPAAPTISVSRSPSIMTANQPYTLSWSTTGTSLLTRVCTALDAGFKSNGVMPLQGPENGTAAVDWVSGPSTCVWTATNPAGVKASYTESMVTNPPPNPTISVSRSPNPMTADQPYTLTWSAGNATSLTRVCTAAGSGFNSNAAMNLQGPENGTASSNWVGYPSTCIWTATNSIGVTAKFTETMTTNPAPLPATISVSRAPSPMTATQGYTLSWSTNNAASLSRVCTAAGGGFTFSGPMNLQGPESGTASANWVGSPSTCVWTAKNSVGVVTNFTETMTTNAVPPAPTISVTRSPATMTANQAYALAWSTTNAVTLNRVCTAVGTGFTFSGAMGLQGPENGTASPNWVGNPSTCIWTATNSVGATAKFTETMTTNPAPLAPTISVSRTPSPMSANVGYTLNWATNNASSLNRVCTSTGSGFTSSGPMSLQGPQNGTASASWVGYPSTCVWTATNSAGVTSTFTETMTTIVPVVSNVTYIHTDGLGSPVARTNAAGALISRTRYEPYGLTAAGATPTIGFTGHVNDSETGLVYMQQRYYDPVAGRFLSIDPVTTDANSGASFNRYNYGNNSPYKYFDPDGRGNLLVTVGGSLVVGGGIEGSAGIYANFYPEPDIGFVLSGGVALGANVGLGAAVASIPGPVSNISGPTTNVNVATPILSGTIMRNPSTGQISGKQVALGAKLGASVAQTNTGTWGLRGLVQNIMAKIAPPPAVTPAPAPVAKPAEPLPTRPPPPADPIRF